MRKLLVKDTTLVMKLVLALGIDRVATFKNDIKEKVKDIEDPQKRESEAGKLYVEFIFESLCLAEKETMSLLASFGDISAKELENSPPDLIMDIIEGFLANNSTDELLSFFKRVQGLITTLY